MHSSLASIFVHKQISLQNSPRERFMRALFGEKGFIFGKDTIGNGEVTEHE